QGQCRFGSVEAQYFGRSRLSGVQGEAASVAKAVEHAPALREASDRLMVVALIEEEAGLLPFFKIHEEADAIVFDPDVLVRLIAPKQSILQNQPFQLADAALCTEVNSVRLEHLNEQVHDHLHSLSQCECCELDDQPTAVAIDDQTGKAVGFAKYQPASLLR